MPQGPVRIGYHTSPFPHDGSDPAAFVAGLERTLTEISGTFDSVWVDDHLLPAFGWADPASPHLECLTTLSWLAGRHPGLTFGSLVMAQSFRNPALVAKAAATLQWLSGGRFVLGLGAGWHEPEYRAYGYDFPAAAVRIAQLAEALRIVRALWEPGPTTFVGNHHRVVDALCEPVPDPPPPIQVGGAGEQLTLRVVAEHADWWNHRGSPAAYGHKLDVLHRHCEAVGRDPGEIVLTWNAEVVAVAGTRAEARRIAAASPFTDEYAVIGTPEEVADMIRPLVDLGVEHLFCRFVDMPSTDGALRFAEEVIPLLR
jgi:alkanesulfonate monooxygenase SsuD/methylene tetrahydromethanopterin reductase-like flavin-dependent oxidoreductase (luciferase family)